MTLTKKQKEEYKAKGEKKKKDVIKIRNKFEAIENLVYELNNKNGNKLYNEIDKLEDKIIKNIVPKIPKCSELCDKCYCISNIYTGKKMLDDEDNRTMYEYKCVLCNNETYFLHK